jgi:hypothetical protein
MRTAAWQHRRAPVEDRDSLQRGAPLDRQVGEAGAAVDDPLDGVVDLDQVQGHEGRKLDVFRRAQPAAAEPQGYPDSRQHRRRQRSAALTSSRKPPFLGLDVESEVVAQMPHDALLERQRVHVGEHVAPPLEEHRRAPGLRRR